MRVRLLFVACTLACPAAAQFGAARPAPAKVRVTSASPPPAGGYLVGEDDCNAAHRVVGTGDQLGVPFVTGTTGSEGQNEAPCYAFGSTSIDNDVWFDWTADQSGLASASTCGGTSVDTKLAAWPFNATCPADGSSLACNDDACGFQSTVTWPVTAGTSYTIQLGTFPGASGGSGTFDIAQSPPPPCGVYDDGTTENALGLVAGGETGWLHFQDCLQTVDLIETAYGTPTGGPPPNSGPSRIACYEDSDCDGDPTTPAGGMTLMWSVATVSVNDGTDLLNPIPYPGSMGGIFTTLAPSSCTFVMATKEHLTGDFPAPMDLTNPTPNAWIMGQTPTGATIDLTNLNNNNVPPLQTDAIGFPTAWLLRAASGDCATGAYPPSCIANSGCPCGNDNQSCNGGCVNSTGTGARLIGTGTASVTSDSLVLQVESTSNQPGLFFQGNDALVPPLMFGDGLRCCGNDVVRIGTYAPTGNATDTATGNLIGGVGPPVSQHPGNAALMPGDLRCYQWWYRDTNGGPCDQGFNLSNSILVVWGP